MLRRCVNPFCNRRLPQFERGRMFVIEFPQRVMGQLSPESCQREEFWLCEDCAPSMTVAVRRDTDLQRLLVRIINLPECGSTKLKFVQPGLDLLPHPEIAYLA
jgi:hypothetical protein